MGFSFDVTRTVPAAAVEAQPVDNNDPIVQKLPGLDAEDIDSLLMSAVGADMTYELGVWDTTAAVDTWIVVDTGTLLNGVPYEVAFQYFSKEGTQIYCRATVAPAADVSLRIKEVTGSGTSAGPLPLGAATETKQDAQIVLETAISSKLPATLGAKAGAASLSVVPATDSGLATSGKQDTLQTAINLIKPGLSGPVVDYSGGDVTYAGGVQLFVAVAGTLKYDDANGNAAQVLSDIPAGVTTPWLVTKVYKVGTSAVLVAVS